MTALALNASITLNMAAGNTLTTSGVGFAILPALGNRQIALGGNGLLGPYAYDQQIFLTSQDAAFNYTLGTTFPFVVGQGRAIVSGTPGAAAQILFNPMGNGFAPLAGAAAPTAPGAPAVGALTTSGRTATLAWTAPASNGGSALLGYIATLSNGRIISVPAGVTSVTFDNLPPGYAVTGQVSAVNVVANGSFSGTSNSVTPGFVIPATPSTVSVSVRARVNAGVGNVPLNASTSSRVFDISQVDATNVYVKFANNWVDATFAGPQERPTGNQVQFSHSILTGLPGGSGLNQTGAVVSKVTYFKAAACLPGFMFKLDGSQPTTGEFAAGGGTISGDGFSIFVPDGWYGRSDDASGISVSARQRFIFQQDDYSAPQVSPIVTTGGTFTAGTVVPVTAPLPLTGFSYLCATVAGITAGTRATYNGTGLIFTADVTLTSAQAIQLNTQRPTAGIIMSGGATGLGDAIKNNSTRLIAVGISDWSGLSGVTTSIGASMTHCVAICGTSASGAKSLGRIGDSIARDNHDVNETGSVFVAGTQGDADCASGFMGRAANTARISEFRAAVSGSAASVEYQYGGNAVRKWIVEDASHLHTTMGHNNRGFPYAGVAGVGFLETERWYHNTYRASSKVAGCKILATNMLPQTTGTMNTAAAQTLGVSAAQAAYNPFIAAGVFNTSLGDPDAGFDLFQALYTWCESAAGIAYGYDGTGNAANGKWPVNGTWVASGNFGSTLEGTHPQGNTSNGIGGIYATRLTSFVV